MRQRRHWHIATLVTSANALGELLKQCLGIFALAAVVRRRHFETAGVSSGCFCLIPRVMPFPDGHVPICHCHCVTVLLNGCKNSSDDQRLARESDYCTKLTIVKAKLGKV